MKGTIQIMAMQNSEIRKILEESGMPEENISKAVEKIRDEYKAATAYFKNDISELKAENGDLKERLTAAENKHTDYETQLKEAEKKAAESAADYKKQYKQLETDFEKYKTDISEREAKAKNIQNLYDICISAGYSEKAARFISRRSDYPDKLKYDDKGEIQNGTEIIKEIQAERDFEVFTPIVQTENYNPPTPPTNAGNTFESMSLSEKMKYANENPNDPTVKSWLEK